MPRAIWKGSISFGLVTIPVELHTAVRQETKVVDLMERLHQSLESRQPARKTTGRKKRARAKPRHAA